MLLITSRSIFPAAKYTTCIYGSGSYFIIQKGDVCVIYRSVCVFVPRNHSLKGMLLTDK